MVGPAIVELARAAVRRLADAAPAASEARHALARIERVGLGPPYTVAIAGELAARTALLNWLAGELLFDPARPDPDRIVMTLQRGAATALRARRRHGVEDRTLDPPPAGDPDRDAPAAPSGPRRFPRGARRADPPGDRAETVPAGDAPAFRDAIVMSAEAETTAWVRRPPWWAVWRWIARGWRALRARRFGRRAPALPTAAAPGERPAGDPAPAPRALANTVPRSELPADPRQQFIAALAACLADATVEKLFVEVGGGPLPAKLVVIELPSGAGARSLDAVGADTCLVACGADGLVLTDQLEDVLTIVPHLFAVGDGEGPELRELRELRELPAPGDPRVRRLAGFAAAASELVRLATIERALAVGAQAIAALASGSSALDAAITRAETEFRMRLDRLEALRIDSPDDHVAAALARSRRPVLDHVHRLIRGALDQLDAAITELGEGWSARLGATTSTEALRAAAAQIDEESPTALGAAQAAAHRALVDGLTERARAHYHELVGELRRGTARSDPAPSWLTVEVAIAELTSSTSLGAVAPRLTSLFRSFDAIKADAVGQLAQRVTRLRQLASATVLDLEPKLEPAVTGTIAIALRGELERHAAWLEAELARERVAIDAERAQLAVLAAARDAARADERELATALVALAAELP